MNLSEIILTYDQLPVFIIIVILGYTIYYYFQSIIPESVNIHPVVLFILLYVMFLIINRIINTNTDFSKPLTQYLIRKKNFKEEPYHINYVNPFVTNLDKVDFNMKKRENKEYTKKILSQLLIRKYVTFQNVLGYISNPWETIKLKEKTLGSGYTAYEAYEVNDKSATIETKKDNNMYCRNFLSNPSTNYSMLLLYRKYVLKFMSKQYFIFEKKNKQHSKYYLRECISQVNIPSTTSGETYTIIDTRDLYYDRQYILFEDLPNSVDSSTKWTNNDGSTTDYINGADDNTKNKYYNKFKDDPVGYHWQDDTKIHDVIVLDIHFIYNQMSVIDEDIMDKTKDKKDFALNKYYEKQSWIEKKYYNFIKYQFTNRIGNENVNISADRLNVYKEGNINDGSTIKFRKAVGNKIDYNTSFIGSSIKSTFDLHLNKTGELTDYLEINKSSGDNSNQLIIDFMGYIRTYLQGKPEKPANELVIVKDKNTKFSEENDLILDKNTISYISFDFLNIKSIKEYRDKMNYIANSIVDKYYQQEVSSIDNIKYNIETLQILQLDSLYRYNKGRSRLVLNNRVITPNNIGIYFKDIKKLRLTYQDFLERVLKYKQTLAEKISKQEYSLNVTNNELLSILNNNPFNTKSKYLCQIEKIDKLETTTTAVEAGNDQYNINLNKDRPLTNGTLVRLKLEEKTYKKPKKNPLFVKFSTTMNINSFNINPNNIYIVHYIDLNNLLKPQYICLEEYLLEPDVSGNITKIVPPTTSRELNSSINLFDCTNMFRKETIGVSNVITKIDKHKFKVVFDNTPLEFKPLVMDTSNNSNNMYVDRPNYVMLNFSKNDNINEINSHIYENQLYKVINIQSTSSNSSAELTLESVIDIDFDSSAEAQNNIFKNILVSQFINSKNYIENVFFKKIEIPKQDRLLSDGPSYKFVIELKKQIISINPEITRNTIIDNYEETMNRIIDLIYENEARKIHYEIPENIGIYRDMSAAVYSYKYKNDLYITYDKRSNPVNLFRNYSSEFLCKKVYRGNNYAVNMISLYYLDSYQEYYKYFINLFKNTLGLHDEINYQCDEYYKSGSMLSNLKLPITFNKYVSFLNNYMLYYKSNIKIDDINPKLLGKHIVINNAVCDNQLISVQNSNRLNSRLYKTFIKDFIYKHEIGRKGFEYDDAKKICERIFTVYDKNCSNQVYKNQPEKQSDYNIEYYKHNKERDKCFTTLYNDEKEKNTYQFIADSKILDPTNQDTEVDKLAGNIDNLKKLKNTCSAKLTPDICVADPNCFYNTTAQTCQDIYNSDYPKMYRIHSAIKDDLNPNDDKLLFQEKNLLGTVTDIIVYPVKEINTSNEIEIDQDTVKFFDLNKNNMNEINVLGIFDKNIGSMKAFVPKKIDKDQHNASKKILMETAQVVQGKPSEKTNFIPQINIKIKLSELVKERGDTLECTTEDDYACEHVIFDKMVTPNIKPGVRYRIRKYYVRSSPFSGEVSDYKIIGLHEHKKNVDITSPIFASDKTFFDSTYNKPNNDDATAVDYKSIVQEVEKSGNLRFYPHRLAHLNEIKTAAYYGAEWDSIGWINGANPLLDTKSNLVKVKDKKVLWVDPNDENAINKGVVCYGRKLDQDKLGANQRNEMFNFQMEKVEQSIKDIQKYENISDFNKEVYSRWNL